MKWEVSSTVVVRDQRDMKLGCRHCRAE